MFLIIKPAKIQLNSPTWHHQPDTTFEPPPFLTTKERESHEAETQTVVKIETN